MASLERLLASDAERSAVVARLQEAATEGRLTLEEFDHRALRAYAARTWPELRELLIDLPTPRAVGTASPHLTGRRRALPIATLGVGIMSIPAGFLFSWGGLIAILGVLFGVYALCAEDVHPVGNRQLTVIGILCALVTPTIFLGLHILIGALPS